MSTRPQKVSQLKTRKRRTDTDVLMLAMCAFFRAQPQRPWIAIAELMHGLAEVVGNQEVLFGMSCHMPVGSPHANAAGSYHPEPHPVRLDVEPAVLERKYHELRRGGKPFVVAMSIDGHFEHSTVFDDRLEDGTNVHCIKFNIYLDTAGLDVESETAWVTFQRESPLTQIVKSFFRGVDLIGGAASGYAGCDYPREIAQGHFYGFLHYESTWYREICKLDWESSGDTRWDRIRSPEWGTYLGADLLRKADPNRTLVDGFVNSDRGEAFASPFAEYLPGGGALFLGSANPGEMAHYGLPCSFDMSGAVQNTVWLWQQFRARGLV